MLLRSILPSQRDRPSLEIRRLRASRCRRARPIWTLAHRNGTVGETEESETIFFAAQIQELILWKSPGVGRLRGSFFQIHRILEPISAENLLKNNELLRALGLGSLSHSPPRVFSIRAGRRKNGTGRRGTGKRACATGSMASRFLQIRWCPCWYRLCRSSCRH